MSKMKYISVEEAAQNWQLSERSVRNYCSQGRVEGALLEGKTWKIPSTAEKPERKTRHSSSEETLRQEEVRLCTPEIPKAFLICEIWERQSISKA